MVDLRVDDPRVDELVRLGLPAVVVGGPLENRALPAVFHDEGSVVVEAVQYLAALGHTRIAQVTGVGEFVHTRQRSGAFERATADLGLAGGHHRDRLQRRAGRTRDAQAPLARPTRRRAIVYDSDLLAVTGLGVAQQMGFSVPDDVSIVGWDDSLISQVVHPPLTAITRDITALRRRRDATSVRGHRRGGAEDVEIARGELTIRGSTGRGGSARRYRLVTDRRLSG